jgi:hypothetical protein
VISLPGVVVAILAACAIQTLGAAYLRAKRSKVKVAAFSMSAEAAQIRDAEIEADRVIAEAFFAVPEFARAIRAKKGHND